HLGDRAGMPSNCPDLAPCPHFPEPDGAATARSDLHPVGAVGDAEERIITTTEFIDLLTRLRVPETDRLAEERGDPLAIRTEGSTVGDTVLGQDGAAGVATEG